MQDNKNSGTKNILEGKSFGSSKTKYLNEQESTVKRSYDIKESTEMKLKELFLKEYYKKDKKATLGQVVDEAINFFCEHKFKKDGI